MQTLLDQIRKFFATGSISPLQVGVWLAVVLVGSKVVMLGSPRPVGPWLLNLVTISFKDVLFAVVVGMLGEIAVRRMAGRPAFSVRMRRTFLGFCVLCAFYSVISAGVFQYFGRPLNYDLLGLIHNANAVRSSISERITLSIGLALIGVPCGFLVIVHWRCHHRHTPVVALVFAAVWILLGWGHQAFAANESLRLSRLALNPHVELFRSIVVGLTGAAKPGFPKNFPPGDQNEFRSFGAREGVRASGFEPLSGAARPRNVIIFILESVGTKYLNLYGSRYQTTPNLVAESAHALLFDNIYAHASFTYPSFRAINFSIYPGLPWCYVPWGGRPLPPTLASILRARGSRTIYLNNGDLDWGASRWMLEQGKGFETTCGYTQIGGTRLSSWGTEDRCVVDRLIQWIEEKPGKPFFAV